MDNRFLAIEDSDEVVTMLEPLIADLGFELVRAATGPDGVKMALEGNYVCILLDMMLPGLEGTEVCKRIRQKLPKVPIIMLTSKSDELNKVLSLELGADDYVTKPYSPSELKARIKAVLRRSERATTQHAVLNLGSIVIDLGRRVVSKDGVPVELTSFQFDLLALLASQPGHPISREKLSEELFGYKVSGFDESLTVHISRIRAKLEEVPANPKIILTVRGVGYCFSVA